tara:strand:+ start:9457 stop:10953 length:1497 start_codon:yes stop_codon:yes gene_type:complete
MDGWGLSGDVNASAILNANTPFFDNALKKYPNSKVSASGKDVGLPEGQMGNSEVGHMNIGAGRIVNQDLIRINDSLSNNGLKTNNHFMKAVNYSKKNNKNFHIMGLLSEGGVHSHSSHLYSILDFLKCQNLDNISLHLFTDGRDSNPNDGVVEISKLLNYIDDSNINLASICGRYYPMDRDSRWERIKLAYDAIVNGIGEESFDIIKSVKDSYANGVTDEFIKPIVCMKSDGNPVSLIEDGDVLFSFNYRSDRMRQLSRVLTQENNLKINIKKKDLHFITMTNYDESFVGINILYDKENLNNTLGEVLEKNNKSQLRIAETEKYPHVTFFFSGGREREFNKEFRILCDSPKVATYDLKPEMSASEVSYKFIEELNNKSFDFACLNFANPDMVGHTGNFNAAIKACEVVDTEVSKITECAINNGYDIIITSDHGNSEKMINDDGSSHTYHTKNLVPFILISDKKNIKLRNGKLGDIAPTILNLMGIEIPNEMTGKSLIN